MRSKVLVFFANAPPAVRKVLKRALASKGYDLRWAANHREAIEFSQNQRPELLRLDFGRPHKRTLHSFEQLQAVNTCVPIILIADQPTRFERAVAGRVAALISKPVEVSRLLCTLSEALHAPPLSG